MSEPDRKAQEVYLAALREKTGWERIRIASKLFDCLKDLTRSGIRAQHTDFTPEQVEAELRRRVLG